MSDLINLLSITNGKATATSKQVSENFGKRHDNVIRDIETIKKDLLNFEEMFFETTLPDSYGRDQKAYIFNRDGFTLLAMGFTGSDAIQWKIKYIQAFNEMEKQLITPQIPQTLPEALRAYANEVENHIKAKSLLEEQKPKVLFADSVAGSNNSILINELAKILNQSGVIAIGQNRLFKTLREQGYLCKISGESYNLPTQRSMDLGIMEIKKSSVLTGKGDTLVTRTTKITPKGQIYFVNKFLNAGRLEVV